jgi:hypothetical protein
MRVFILSLLLVLLLMGSARAQNAVSYPVCSENQPPAGQIWCAKLAHGNGTLVANNYCECLTNSSNNTYFIPLRTGTERGDFVNAVKGNPGLGVTLVQSCCTAPQCGGHLCPWD